MLDVRKGLSRDDVSQRLLALPVTTQAVFLHLTLYAGHAGVIAGRALMSAKRLGADSRRQLRLCINELAQAGLVEFEDRDKVKRLARVVRIARVL